MAEKKKEETTDPFNRALYPSNSYKSKDKQPSKEVTEKVKVEKIVTGPVIKKKKTLGDKFKETFMVSDSKEVSRYVFLDVIVPTIKELFIDIINKGSNMLIFGDTRSASKNLPFSGGRTTRVNYGNYSSSSLLDNRRQIDYRMRATHNFDNLIFRTKWEAEEVRDKLVELIYAYGQATVADLYDAAGITSEYTDRKYGWEELGSAKIRRVVDGYVIILPKAVLLGD